MNLHFNSYLSHAFSLMLPVLLALTGCQPSGSPASESAESALSTFALDSGFQIELVASEPLILS